MNQSSIVSVSAFLLAATATGSFAQDAAPDFYKGKQLSFIVHTGPGTGFDSSSRLISRYLPKYIPGAPTIVVRNMAGAGGVVAANWLYNIAPKDGLAIGMTATNIPFNPLYGDKASQFDATRFNWLGSPSRETALLVVWGASPFTSIDVARKTGMRLATTGAASTPAIYGRLLAYVLDLKVELIHGYKSQQEEFIALERGEHDGIAAPYWSSIQAEKPDWLRDKKIRILTYWGAEAIPEIPGPYVFDLIMDPEKKRTMEIAQGGLALGRPITAPPDVDEYKLDILRSAVNAVFKDKEYLGDCARLGLECRYPVTGAELLSVIKRAYAQPKESIDRVAAFFTNTRN